MLIYQAAWLARREYLAEKVRWRHSFLSSMAFDLKRQSGDCYALLASPEDDSALLTALTYLLTGGTTTQASHADEYFHHWPP